MERAQSSMKAPFGVTPDGAAVESYILRNAGGMEARIITYGATVVSLRAPDRDGRMADVVLGHDTLDGCLADASSYMGPIVGRYANRIANGRFALDGREHQVTRNAGRDHLHGGAKGFDKVVWTVERFADDLLQMTYMSRDGEEGYPGTLRCAVAYRLTDANELRIEYEATSYKPTVVNLTNHSYFNLGGHDSGDVLDHVLTVHADRFTPTDDRYLPTGEIREVQGTPLDFRAPVALGARIGRTRGGYDHNVVLNSSKGEFFKAALLRDPRSGRVMEVFTTEPGMQLYTGNFLDGSQRGKNAVYNKHAGVCFEAQHFPDSPNRPEFPSTVLRPGETYTQTTAYRFSTG